MDLVLLLGVGMVFTALFLVLAAVGGLTRERAASARSMEVLEALTTAPDESSRSSTPPSRSGCWCPSSVGPGIGRKITPADANDRIREKLDKAGNPRAGRSSAWWPARRSASASRWCSRCCC